VGWTIPVDATAIERYDKLAASPLKAQIVAAIAPAPRLATENASSAASGTDSPATSGVAGAQSILRLQDDGRCTLLTSESLCSIHAQLGEEFLPSVCASYPRVQRQLGPVAETALALSCPEAARVVLLGPSLLDSALVQQSASSDLHSGAPAYYAEIRSTMLALVCARNLPLWQRLFFVCLLCHRLDSIESGLLRVSVPDYVAIFLAGAFSGALVPQIESLPFDPQRQLDAILRLAGLMLHRSRVTPRFAETIAAFTSGIGNGPTATLPTLTVAYNAAHRQWFEPFERRYPHVLENYLINLIVFHRFPFGRASDSTSFDPHASGSALAAPSKGREFARLAAQFALTRGILIGVAGHYRECFSAEHVVHTVQALSRHFDHHPEFLASAHALLIESRLDGLSGLSILLRNTPSEQPRPATEPISAVIAARQAGHSQPARS
jgi:lysine-N-methylase